MRGHPNFSGQILERISALEPAALWVAAHHERMDGKGYPEMLSGTEISAEAGILSLADAYVAIVSPGRTAILCPTKKPAPSWTPARAAVGSLPGQGLAGDRAARGTRGQDRLEDDEPRAAGPERG